MAAASPGSAEPCLVAGDRLAGFGVVPRAIVPGAPVGVPSRLAVVAIEPLEGIRELVDITTGSGDFIANGDRQPQLLRAPEPRLRRPVARPRFRDPALLQGRRGAAARGRAVEAGLCRTPDHARRQHRPLPAGREEAAHHPQPARGAGALPAPGDDRHQGRADRARPRPARRPRPRRARARHAQPADARCAVEAHPRAARGLGGRAAAADAPAEGGGRAGRRAGRAGDSGADGPRDRARARGAAWPRARVRRAT